MTRKGKTCVKKTRTKKAKCFLRLQTMTFNFTFRQKEEQRTSAGPQEGAWGWRPQAADWWNLQEIRNQSCHWINPGPGEGEPRKVWIELLDPATNYPGMGQVPQEPVWRFCHAALAWSGPLLCGLLHPGHNNGAASWWQPVSWNRPHSSCCHHRNLLLLPGV